MITLDTIALYKDYSTLKDLLQIEVYNNLKSYFNESINNEKKAFTFTLFECFKKQFFNYGIEHITITKNSKTLNNSYRLSIQFNAKLLGVDYLKGINKNNIDVVLDKIYTTIKPYFKIKFDDFKSFNVGIIDCTKNIINNNRCNITTVLKAIKSFIKKSRAVKDISNAYINAGTFTIKLSNKERYLIYDKHNELNEDKNKPFITLYKELATLSKNIIRFETRIISKKRIKKILCINLLENECLNIYKVLNSEINVVYNRLFDYTKSIKSEKSFTNIDNFENLNYKSWLEIITGYGLSMFAIDDIVDYIKRKSNNRATSNKRINKINTLVRAYKNYTNKNNLINFNDVLNNVLNSLKVA